MQRYFSWGDSEVKWLAYSWWWWRSLLSQCYEQWFVFPKPLSYCTLTHWIEPLSTQVLVTVAFKFFAYRKLTTAYNKNLLNFPLHQPFWTTAIVTEKQLLMKPPYQEYCDQPGLSVADPYAPTQLEQARQKSSSWFINTVGLQSTESRLIEFVLICSNNQLSRLLQRCIFVMNPVSVPTRLSNVD